MFEEAEVRGATLEYFDGVEEIITPIERPNRIHYFQKYVVHLE